MVPPDSQRTSDRLTRPFSAGQAAPSQPHLKPQPSPRFSLVAGAVVFAAVTGIVRFLRRKDR